IDVNSRDSLDRTPLILASISGHGTVIAQLLKKNANLLSKDYYGRTALHYASMGGHASVVRVLSLHNQSSKIIDDPDIYGKSPLGLAVDHNAGAVVALLIFYGAKDLDGNAKKLLDSSIHKGSFAAVEAILDIKAGDSEDGKTPLHWAVWRDSLQASTLLLSRGANAEAKDKHGYRALHYAAK
ncbi:ankyrin, partial [Wilcoxina mikolae CBS 423.85]